MEILITGGAGYIGSTIASALKDEGHTPIILDSLVTGKEEFTRGHIFYKADIADTHIIERIFDQHPDIYATIHCAALISVPESVEKPYPVLPGKRGQIAGILPHPQPPGISPGGFQLLRFHL